jgi:hypothetical protein
MYTGHKETLGISMLAQNVVPFAEFALTSLHCVLTSLRFALTGFARALSCGFALRS